MKKLCCVLLHGGQEAVSSNSELPIWTKPRKDVHVASSRDVIRNNHFFGNQKVFLRLAMNKSYSFFLLNIFKNPILAAREISRSHSNRRIAVKSFLIAASLYIIIVLMGYNALGWEQFDYKYYYEHYFDPFWWEVVVVPIWGLVIAFGFGIPCYYIGAVLGGKGTFEQITAYVLLASIVSLPIFVAVDVFTIIYDPEWIVRFATEGTNFIPYDSYPNKIVWLIESYYAAVAMTWQGIVTLIGVTVIHKNKWYANIPAIIVGNIIFIVFLLLIRDYVALII